MTTDIWTPELTITLVVQGLLFISYLIVFVIQTRRLNQTDIINKQMVEYNKFMLDFIKDFGPEKLTEWKTRYKQLYEDQVQIDRIEAKRRLDKLISTNPTASLNKDLLQFVFHTLNFYEPDKRDLVIQTHFGQNADAIKTMYKELWSIPERPKKKWYQIFR